MKKLIHNPFIIPFMIVAIMLIFTDITFAYGMTPNKTDKQIVKEYCSTHYPNMRIKYFTEYDEEVITHRKDTNTVWVQIETSVSSGKKDRRNGMYWGYVKGQNYYKTWYNKKVKKGKTVKSYYIFNPYTNYEDDIVAVVDNQKIR